MAANYRLGDRVEWDWGEGAASGEIASIHTQNVTKTIGGEKVSREADPGRPAYTVRKDNGELALVARHEITLLDGGPSHAPRTRQEALETSDYLGEPGAPSQGGDAGGDLQEKVGKRDEHKRARERPAGATRVRGDDERK